MHNKVDKAVEVRMLLSYEQNVKVVQMLLKQTCMGFARKKVWDLHKNRYNVKGTRVQACEHFFHLSYGQLKRSLSHLGQTANMKIDNLLWTTANLST